MEGTIVVLVVILVVLGAGVGYLIYRDIKRRKAAFLEARAAEAATREAEEKAESQVEDENEKLLREDTESRRRNIIRIKIAACEFSDPVEVDQLIWEIKVTRLCIQNLTAQKLEQEAVKELKIVLGTAKSRENLLRGEPLKKD